MKNVNKKLMNSTQKTYQDSLSKSRKRVYKLTHPSKRVSRIGSVIGGSVGVCLVLAGTTGVILGSGLWGIGSMIAGATTITSNAINVKRTNKNNW